MHPPFNNYIPAVVVGGVFVVAIVVVTDVALLVVAPLPPQNFAAWLQLTDGVTGSLLFLRSTYTQDIKKIFMRQSPNIVPLF